LIILLKNAHHNDFPHSVKRQWLVRDGTAMLIVIEFYGESSTGTDKGLKIDATWKPLAVVNPRGWLFEGAWA
jgi:hypothetical protein